MSLSQVRTYFEARMTAVDSTVYKWTQPFENNQIPRNIKAKSYYLDFGAVSSQPLNDNFVRDEMDVTLQLFLKGTLDVESNIDTALDLAHNIRMNAVSPTNAMSGANIKNVVCNSIEASTVDGSDNSVLVNINFSVTLLFNF